MDSQEIAQLTRHISEALQETAAVPQREIYGIIESFGAETAQALLEKTLSIEAAGGLLISKGSRRRTPGGVFFHLARQLAETPEQKAIFLKPHPSDKRLFVNYLPGEMGSSELRELFEHAGEVKQVERVVEGLTGRLKNHAYIEMATKEGAQEAIRRLHGTLLTDRPLVVAIADPIRKSAKKAITEPSPKKAELPKAEKPPKAPKQPAPTPLPQWPPFVYTERSELFQRLTEQKGQASSVKITLIGKPGAIEQRQNLIITTISHKHKLPLGLPKGVPQPPETPTDYVVYIASKQWKAASEALVANGDDVLIVEGVCSYDDQLPGMAVFATNVTTKLLQQAKKTPKQGPIKPAEDSVDDEK